MNNLGEKIRNKRKELGLSQPELAKILNVSNGIISQWENNIYEPKASYLKLLAETLNVSTDYLLGLEDDLGNKIYNDFRFNQGTINNKF